MQGTLLNLYINFRRIDIFTILSLSMNMLCFSIYLCLNFFHGCFVFLAYKSYTFIVGFPSKYFIFLEQISMILHV